MTIACYRLPIIALLAALPFPLCGARASEGGRYLTESYEELGYALQPPPVAATDDERTAIDLDQVRAAQLVDSEQRREAFADANAFDFDDLLPRFSEAAGTLLTPERRPVLAHMLRRALGDAGAYGHDIKAQYARARPYRLDPAIQPCALSYLRSSDERSYPSGHSTNGYLAAMVVSDVLPHRRNLVMARGTRYGTNRIVCGAHFPSDVAAGQLFARFLYKRIAASPVYQADLACARLEADADEKGKLPSSSEKIVRAYDDGCNALASQYRTEMAHFAKPPP